MGTILLSRASLDGLDPSEAEAHLVAELGQVGHNLLEVPHLYHVPDADGLWDRLRSLPRPMVVVSCLQPRAMEWVLARHGIGPAGVSCLHYSQSTQTGVLVDQVARLLTSSVNQPMPDATPTRERLTATQPPRERWYPVVDKSRCVDCGHCSEFCLFGVYEIRDGKVNIVQPDRCKPGCPACSRICPTSAIMFPLYHRDPAIAGVSGQFVKVDDSAREMFKKRTGKTLEGAPPKLEFSDLDDLVSDLESFGKGRRP